MTALSYRKYNAFSDRESVKTEQKYTPHGFYRISRQYTSIADVVSVMKVLSTAEVYAS